MEHLTAIMILISCSGANTCHELPAPTVGYETPAACEQALRPAMMTAVKSAPQVYGTCAKVAPAVFDEDATVTWDLSRDGKISVTVVNDDKRIAEEGTVVASR